VADLSLSLQNDFGELPSLAENVSIFLESHQAPDETVFAANLAIEELVTNIIKYGYDDRDAHTISLRLSLTPESLQIEIRDDGHEFNPFNQPEPDTTLPANERDIGGLGIHFVRKMLDSCDYCRQDGTNIVTVTKKL